MAHGGANAAKKTAFAAIKDVIENGALVYQASHGRQDSFYISAPVGISGRDNIVTALIRRDMNTQRLYLHSVILKENLLKPSVSAADAKTSEPHSATTSGDTQRVTASVQGRKADSAEVAAELRRLLALNVQGQADTADAPRFSRKAGDAQQQFKDTERAYGGRAAYEQAKAAGKTKLTYGQWVQVRTPNFKQWFGDWEAVRAQQRLDAMEPVTVELPKNLQGADIGQLREAVKARLDALAESGTTATHPEVGEIGFSKGNNKKVVSTLDGLTFEGAA